MASRYEKELLEVAKKYVFHFVGHDVSNYDPDSFDDDIVDQKSFEFFQKLHTTIEGDGCKITTIPRIFLDGWKTVFFRFDIYYQASTGESIRITTGFKHGVYSSSPKIINDSIGNDQLTNFRNELLTVLLKI